MPPTERRGRVHSSTVTVAIIDSVKAKNIEFNSKDFRIEWYSGTGAGGQHRNKHQNSCRLTHIPSGVVATAQCRSRENSLEEAKATLLARVNSTHHGEAGKLEAANRKTQIGSGMRGDKIRTYRFQDDSVKDHQTNRSASISQVMNGNFHLLWN